MSLVESHEVLIREWLSYDPLTGIITWARPKKKVNVGEEAGSFDSKGYRRICVGYHTYRAHRLAWFLHYGQWPAGEVDHINRDKLDNRITNLRDATRSQNRANSRLCKKNGGLKGAYWNSTAKKWYAQCRHANLGYFSTEEEAHAAYIAAAKLHFGEFARAS